MVYMAFHYDVKFATFDTMDEAISYATKQNKKGYSITVYEMNTFVFNRLQAEEKGKKVF